MVVSNEKRAVGGAERHNSRFEICQARFVIAKSSAMLRASREREREEVLLEGRRSRALVHEKKSMDMGMG